MKKLMMIALAACAAAGCSVKKIEYTKNDKGEVSYRIYQNEHWLNTEGSGIRGGMTGEGRFEFAADGLQTSPSEEYNKMMSTTFQGFASLARLAASMYSPAAASIPLTTEAADPAATAKLVEAQADAKVALANAKADAAVKKIEAKAKAEAAAKCATGACTDGSCQDCTSK